jgi:beta-lactam-binding protein with PASTA domain
LKKKFQESDVQGCEGKVIGTNVAQGAVMSTGDTLIFIVNNLSTDS